MQALNDERWYERYLYKTQTTISVFYQCIDQCQVLRDLIFSALVCHGKILRTMRN